MELSLEENFTENREQLLDDEVDEIMDYVFGEYLFCEEHDDSSEEHDDSSEEHDDSSEVEEVEDSNEVEDNSEYFD